MRGLLRKLLTFLTLLGAAAGTAAGQTPATAAQPGPPPPPWTGSAGLGLSLNRGNTDTTNFNLSFEATHDPKTPQTRSVWRFKGLYMRGENNGSLAVDRLALDARDELTLTPRVYAFGQLQFLKDHFKSIDYLWAPSGGIGYKLIATPVTTFNVDGGVGFKAEKNPGHDLRKDFIVTAGDKFEYNLSKTSKATQGFGAIWKAADFGDALYTFTAGAAASMTTRTQLKVELLDTYATRPPDVTVKKNDVALLTALVYKF
jgi:putative salt-induced outer membrane protein